MRKRTQHLAIYCTDAEYFDLRRKAARYGLSASSYCRLILWPKGERKLAEVPPRGR